MSPSTTPQETCYVHCKGFHWNIVWFSLFHWLNKYSIPIKFSILARKMHRYFPHIVLSMQSLPLSYHLVYIVTGNVCPDCLDIDWRLLHISFCRFSRLVQWLFRDESFYVRKSSSGNLLQLYESWFCYNGPGRGDLRNLCADDQRAIQSSRYGAKSKTKLRTGEVWRNKDKLSLGGGLLGFEGKPIVKKSASKKVFKSLLKHLKVLDQEKYLTY